MAVRSRKPKKSEADESPEQSVIRQIDTLQTLASDYRREWHGPEWFKELRDFYNMAFSPVRSPSFRPAISVPQLQMLSINEASDLADLNPRIYIVEDGKRQRDRENALESMWRECYANNQLMMASIWSMLNGNGYVQTGYDSYARRGKGAPWIRMRDPESIYIDPAATSEDDWHYVQWEDRLYPEEIVRLWPETGRRVKARPATSFQPDSSTSTTSMPLQLTSGPMSSSGGPPNMKMGPADGRVTVRYTHIFDPTVQEIARGEMGTDTEMAALVPAKFELKYPNGRLLVDAEGVVLFDGDNPCPDRKFPLVRVLGLPPLNTIYAPAPLRMCKPLQITAERMFTQCFENAVRLNNGTWFIDENTGISAEDFGGIPAEVRVIASNSRMPELKMVKPFPPHMLEYPKFLLGLSKELWGFTQSRQGTQSPGNVGVDLFEASVFQSQAMTRMRAKLMAESVHRIATQFFNWMAAYHMDDSFPDHGDKEFKMTRWEKIRNPEAFNVYVDPASIQPISQAALSKMVPALRKEGLIGSRDALEMMGLPAAAEMADNLEKEKALDALNKLKKR